MPLPEEHQMIELKYASPCFRMMNDITRDIASQSLLLKIHVITGWVIPNDDDILSVLQYQFCLKLSEKYGNMNCEEIEYAFRNKESDIKDWGKSMNLSLLDEVLNPYLEKRFELSRIEESIRSNLNNFPVKQLDYIDETLEEKQTYLAEWENREDFNINNVPPFLYDYLVEFEKINPTPEQKWEYFYKAADIRKANLFRDSEDAMMRGSLNAKYVAAEYQAFLVMYRDKKYNETENNRIRILAKKLMIVDYLILNRNSKIGNTAEATA